MFAPSIFQIPSGRLTYRPLRKLMRCALSDAVLRTPEGGAIQQFGGVAIGRAVLLDALHKDQIQTWLQPKVEVHSQKLVAWEALARWRHPQLGLLTPNVFLPWFSEHGLDEALLMHILQEVLGLQAYWRRQGVVMPVSVNLPTHLLDDAGLPDRLSACVQAKQGRACDITFELLENSDTKTPCTLFMGACRLVAMGFGLAQDDVGVGYSSMDRLVCVPFSELKLDRRLVHGLSADRQQAAQALSWITSAKARGLRVTAEGVEVQADLELLQQMGCDYAQGYLFAKPAPAFELGMWMRQRWGL